MCSPIYFAYPELWLRGLGDNSLLSTHTTECGSVSIFCEKGILGQEAMWDRANPAS